MGKCTQERTPDTAPSLLKKQLLEAARDPLAAWLDEKVHSETKKACQYKHSTRSPFS